MDILLVKWGETNEGGLLVESGSLKRNAILKKIKYRQAKRQWGGLLLTTEKKNAFKKKEDSSRTAPRPLWWKATKDVVRSLSIKKKKTKLNNAYQKVVQVIVFLFWGITRNVHFINLLYWGNENIILNLSSSFQPTIAAFWQKTSRAEGKVQAPKSSLSQLPAVFESQHLVKTNKLQKEYKWLAALRIKMAEEE